MQYKTQSGKTICFDPSQTMLTSDYQNGKYQMVLMWTNEKHEMRQQVLGEYDSPAALDSAMGSVLWQERSKDSQSLVIVPR